MVKRIAAIICLSALVPVLAVVAALSGSAAVGGAWRWLAIGVAASLVSTGLAVTYLVRRYQPAMLALRGGFQDLAATIA